MISVLISWLFGIVIGVWLINKFAINQLETKINSNQVEIKNNQDLNQIKLCSILPNKLEIEIDKNDYPVYYKDYIIDNVNGILLVTKLEGDTIIFPGENKSMDIIFESGCKFDYI